MVARFFRSFAIVAALILARGSVAAQDPGVRTIGDSISIRFLDAELRSVVRALGQYLDRSIVITGLPGTRVTLETPRPVTRDAILPLLRGLLETQQLELVSDTVAGLYRVRPREPARPIETREGGGSVAPSATAMQLYTIRLRHARSADVAATVNALYGRTGAVGELGARAQTLGAGLRDARLPSGAPVPSSAVAAVAGVEASFGGEVTIVPDPGTNSLMVRAAQRDFELIQAAVQELDVRPLQVLIEVLIAEVRKDKGFSFGVATSLPATKVPGTTNTTVSGSTTGIGLGDFVLSVMDAGGVDLDATLRAAAARGDVSIVSRPIVIAANNELAEILVGSQRPFVQISRSLPTDAPQRDQVVQYRDVGTQLTVRPTISADGYVMLQVTQEVNAVTSETAFDAPVISTRSVQTRLLVKDGQTAVLGGLSDRQRDRNKSGVPLLSAIPFLGGLFGRATNRTTETELFLFLTPTVLYSDADVEGATKPLRGRMIKEDK